MNNLWTQGKFIYQRKYQHWSKKDIKKAEYQESLKVRPSPKGNHICICNNPDDAKWIADRLNLATNLENKIKNIKNVHNQNKSKQFYINGKLFDCI